jgi:hypothetical protein
VSSDSSASTSSTASVTSTLDDDVPAVVVSHGLQYTQIVPVHTTEANATATSTHTHTVRYVASPH